MGRGPNKHPRKQRPPEWNPEWFLAWRAANPAVPIESQYYLWASEWGTSRDSIKAEIRIWKKTVAGFRTRLEAVDPGSTAPQKLDFAHALDESSGDWRQRFCGFYRIHHNRKQAADESGLAWETVRKKLDPRPTNSDFDGEFHALVKEIEAETLEKARAGIKTALDIAADQEDARTLGKLSLDVLERREPAEWARNQRVEVAGTIFHAPLAQRRAALGEALAVSRQVVSVERIPEALPEHAEGQSLTQEERDEAAGICSCGTPNCTYRHEEVLEAEYVEKTA